MLPASAPFCPVRSSTALRRTVRSSPLPRGMSCPSRVIAPSVRIRISRCRSSRPAHWDFLDGTPPRARLCARRAYALSYRYRLAEHLIRVAPLVVVPAHDLDQVAVDHLGQLEIDDGCAGVADDVRRNERIM